MAKSTILEFPLLGEVSRSLNVRSDPGTVQIVYVDCVCRDVLKLKNPWVLKSPLNNPCTFSRYRVGHSAAIFSPTILFDEVIGDGWAAIIHRLTDRFW